MKKYNKDDSSINEHNKLIYIFNSQSFLNCLLIFSQFKFTINKPLFLQYEDPNLFNYRFVNSVSNHNLQNIVFL